MGSIIASTATRGHGVSYELSHCVAPKELSAAAAWPHVLRMWALDPAQRAGSTEGGWRLCLGTQSAPTIWPVSLSLNWSWPLYCLVVKQPSKGEKDYRVRERGQGGGWRLHVLEPGTDSPVLVSFCSSHKVAN